MAIACLPLPALATLNILSNSSSSPLQSIQNYDFPGFDTLDQPYATEQSQIIVGTFLPPTDGNICRLDMAGMERNANGTKLDQMIMILNPVLAIDAGCRLYEDVPGMNGWYEPGAKRPFRLVVMILHETGKYCCKDEGESCSMQPQSASPFENVNPNAFPFLPILSFSENESISGMGRLTAQYTLTKFGRFQDSSVILTGVNADEGRAIIKAYKSDPTMRLTVTSEGATDEGTLLLKRPSVKAYTAIRLILYILLFVYEVVTTIYMFFTSTDKPKLFAKPTLKSIVSCLLFVWSLGLLLESIFFFMRSTNPEGFPFSPQETTLTVALRWGGFTVGFIGFSLMVLVWAKTGHSLKQDEDSWGIIFMKNHFGWITIAGMVIVGSLLTWVVIAIAWPFPEKVKKSIEITAVALFICMTLQAAGYFYYASHIVSQTKRAVEEVKREAGSRRTEREMTNMMVIVKMTLLAVAVIFGWLFLSFDIIIQTFWMTIQSNIGFWMYNAVQDFVVITLMILTFTSLNLRLLPTLSSNGTRTATLSKTTPAPQDFPLKNLAHMDDDEESQEFQKHRYLSASSSTENLRPVNNTLKPIIMSPQSSQSLSPTAGTASLPGRIATLPRNGTVTSPTGKEFHPTGILKGGGGAAAAAPFGGWGDDDVPPPRSTSAVASRRERERAATFHGREY
ncbi:hypothetical protein HDU97_003589 [Phlyctochytrium planicorne]|nr:hypothetical protein HDU97_003589 [Phlyctochytrium planicorne]